MADPGHPSLGPPSLGGAPHRALPRAGREGHRRSDRPMLRSAPRGRGDRGSRSRAVLARYGGFRRHRGSSRSRRRARDRVAPDAARADGHTVSIRWHADRGCVMSWRRRPVGQIIMPPDESGFIPFAMPAMAPPHLRSRSTRRSRTGRAISRSCRAA